MEPQGIDATEPPPGAPPDRPLATPPAVSSDGKFFRPADADRRCLLLVEGAVDQVAATGADGVVTVWPPPPELLGAALRAGLTVAADVGPGVRGHPDVGLWLAFGDEPAASALRALRREALVAGPIEDERSGRCAGQAVAARFSERGEEDLVGRLMEVQVAARRRPVVAELAGGEGLAERLAAAADLGYATLVVRAEPDGAQLDAVAEHLRREGQRLDGAPLISVLVCAHNEEEAIGDCLRSVERMGYPSFEVIVADDGSSDSTREIARRAGAQVLELEHGRLSAARNAAARAARGEIVAFLDADAAAHPDWLAWLWRGFDRLGADGVSGPNYPFPGAGLQERAVAGAPGAPVPAVNPDGSATHLPGCSMAFRRELVLEIGFEEGTTTGEDALFCAAAIERGARLFYHPTAAIDHHRRATVAAYLRQQRSYGALLSMDDAAHGIVTGDIPQTPLHSRLNPFKRRHIFSGAQEEGLYAQRAHGANTLFPLKLTATVAAAGLAAGPLAWAVGRTRQWALGTLGSLAAVFAWIAACVPTPAGARGPAGILQRALTAFLWLAKPVAHRLGARGRGR